MNKNPVLVTLGNSGSSVLDPSFPRVAAMAALEVDNALLRVQRKKGAPTEFQVDGVSALLPIIQRILEAASASKSLREISVRVDPASANVFVIAYGQAAPEAEKNHTVGKQKIVEAATRVAEVLGHVKDRKLAPLQNKTSQLKFARDFCRALSDTAAVRQYAPHAAMQGLRRTS